MDTILLELAEDEPQQSVGAVSAADVADDVGLRSDTLAAAASAVASRFEDGHADGEHHDDDGKDPAPISDSTGDGQKKGKYPRVDAPEVEGQAAMAIREDTPGYIAQAFPKLFPHGTGDFHDSQGGRTAVGSPNRMLNFAAWGRYVLTWHDGRFMRHSRFRYWLLDAPLRAMTPGM